MNYSIQVLDRIEAKDYFDLTTYNGQPVVSSGYLREFFGLKGLTQDKVEEMTYKGILAKGDALEALLDLDGTNPRLDRIQTIKEPLDAVGIRMAQTYDPDEQAWFDKYYELERQSNKSRKEETAKKHFLQRLDNVVAFIEAQQQGKIIVVESDLAWIAQRLETVYLRYPWAFADYEDQHGILFKVTVMKDRQQATLYGKALIDRVVTEVPIEGLSTAIIDFKCSARPASQWRSLIHSQRIDVQLAWYLAAWRAATGQDDNTAFVIIVGDGYDKLARLSDLKMDMLWYGYQEQRTFHVNGEKRTLQVEHEGIIDKLFKIAGFYKQIEITEI